MFSLQAGTQTLRVAEYLQLNSGECHYVIYEVISFAFPLCHLGVLRTYL